MYNNDLFDKTAQFLDCLFTDIDKGLKNLHPGDEESFTEKFRRSNREGGFHGSVHRGPARNAASDAGTPHPFYLRADMREVENTIIINAELPGVNKQDISVDYRGEEIFVRGTKCLPEGLTREDFLENNRRYGEYARTFKVGKVQPDSIHAAYENGVLTITCAKQEESSKGIVIE